MKLTDLLARFVRYEQRDGQVTMPIVDTLEEAQGVMFLCPRCFEDNGGRVGTHSVICWSKTRGVPDDATPGPGRWLLVGTGLDDLTLEGESGNSRSVLLNAGCRWHGFVTKGDAS